MNVKNNMKAVAWIMGWIIAFTTATTLTKFLSSEVSSWAIVLMRSLFGMIYLSPFLIQRGKEVLRVRSPALQLVRVIFSTGATVCTYFAYKNLPISIATSIGLSAPLIVPVVSILILKERVPLQRWAAILLGYFGVLCIVRPTLEGIEWAMGVALLANVLAAFAMVTTKILSKRETTQSLLLNTGIAMFVLSGTVNVFQWHSFSWEDGIVLALIAGAGLLSQYCSISALRLVTPSFMAPFEYSRLIFAVGIDILLFSQFPTFLAMGGALMIVIASYIVVQSSREPQLQPQVR